MAPGTPTEFGTRPLNTVAPSLAFRKAWREKSGSRRRGTSQPAQVRREDLQAIFQVQPADDLGRGGDRQALAGRHAQALESRRRVVWPDLGAAQCDAVED